MSKTAPASDGANMNSCIDPGNIDVDALDIPPWLKDGLKKLDLDGDGLEESEVADMLARCAEEKRMAKYNVDEIHYTHMPTKVQEVMRSWDHDLSGSVSVGELTAAAKAQQKLQQENRMVKRLLFAAVIVIILLGILNFVMSLLAVETGKDFAPRDPTATTGRRLTAGGGTRSAGALEDKNGQKMGTTTPTTEYDMCAFVSPRQDKKTVSRITMCHFYDPGLSPSVVVSRFIKNAEYRSSSLHMVDTEGHKLIVSRNCTLTEVKSGGGARIIQQYNCKALNLDPDAGYRTITIESPPEEAEEPELDVPELEEICRQPNGTIRCNVTQFEDYILEEANYKGGPAPTVEEITRFFDSADCNHDQFLTKDEYRSAERCVPCVQPRRLQTAHPAQRPVRVRRLQEARGRSLRALSGMNDSGYVAAGPPDNCVPIHIFTECALMDNPSTQNLSSEHRGPATAVLRSLDANKDGCVDDAEFQNLKPEHLEGTGTADCSKVNPPRSCRCLPDGVDSFKVENKGSLSEHCNRTFNLLDRNGDGLLTRKECDEGSATKGEELFFRILRFMGTCPQNTGYIPIDKCIDYMQSEGGKDQYAAHFECTLRDVNEDNMLDFQEINVVRTKLLNELNDPVHDAGCSGPGTSGGRRRLRAVQTMLKPKIAARIQQRERRRVLRELETREQMLHKVGADKHSTWLEARINGNRRRLLSETNSELRQEDLAAMTTESLRQLNVDWHESVQHDALQAQFDFLPSSARRLLGLKHTNTRRLQGNMTADEEEFLRYVEEHFGTLDDFLDAVSDMLDFMKDPAAQAKYDACPSPFYAHREVDSISDDVDTVHEYWPGTDLLVGEDAVTAVVNIKGITSEQARHEIERVRGPSGRAGGGIGRRLRRMSSDPFLSRRLTGADTTNQESHVLSLDQCEFLKIIDRQYYKKLLSKTETMNASIAGERDYCTVGHDISCLMPTNAFEDPTTGEMRVDDHEIEIDFLECAAYRVPNEPACYDLPWEEQLLPLDYDANGTVIMNVSSEYYKNWNPTEPGIGCAPGCCTTEDPNDCLGDKLRRTCQCLEKKRQCLEAVAKKCSKGGNTGGSQGRRLRRLAHSNIVNTRRRLRRMEKLPIAEGRRLMVRDRERRLEMPLTVPDGTFCSASDNSYSHCISSPGCTYQNGTMTCVACTDALTDLDCVGSCTFANGICELRDECSNMSEQQCSNTPGCAFVGASCVPCRSLSVENCAGPGCRLEDDDTCQMDDGESFNYDACPLRVTFKDAMCEEQPDTCGQEDSVVKRAFSALTNDTKDDIRRATKEGVDFALVDFLHTYLTTLEFPVDLHDIQDGGGATAEIGVGEQANVFEFCSSDEETLSTADVEACLQLCEAPQEENPADGGTNANFCENLHIFDKVIRSYVPEGDYSIPIREAEDLLRSVWHDVKDFSRGKGIDRMSYICACANIYGVSAGRCSRHFTTLASNPEDGADPFEAATPLPSSTAMSAAMGEPSTPGNIERNQERNKRNIMHDKNAEAVKDIVRDILWRFVVASDSDDIQDPVEVCDRPARLQKVTLASLEDIRHYVAYLRQRLATLSNYFVYNSTDDRAPELAERTASFVQSCDAALSAMDVILNATPPPDYVTLYDTPRELLILLCEDLFPPNLPFRQKNVIVETGDGNATTFSDLDPEEQPAITMAEDESYDMYNNNMCYWQDEQPIMFKRTDMATGTTFPMAMRWLTTLNAATSVTCAASRVMSTGCWPWQDTVDECVDEFFTFFGSIQGDSQREKRYKRLQSVNGDSNDPELAASQAMLPEETPPTRQELIGICKSLAPDSRCISHRIASDDYRSPEDACSEYRGVQSGIEMGSLDATCGVFSAPETVNIFQECLNHRASQSAAEWLNDLREHAANTAATSTMTARLRRRLAAEYKGENSFPESVRRLFHDRGVNPVSIAVLKQHPPHERHALRARSRILRVKRKERARALRRRLETGDHSIALPTIGNELTSSAVDRKLSEDNGVEAARTRLAIEFLKEVWKEKKMVRNEKILKRCTPERFQVVLEVMHSLYAVLVPIDAPNTHYLKPCVSYNPIVSTLPVVDTYVVLPGNDTVLLERCLEKLHFAVPVEIEWYGDAYAQGDIKRKDFLDAVFSGRVDNSTECEREKKKIFDNPTQFDEKCYCQCYQKDTCGKTVDAECSMNPVIDGVADSKTVCQIIDIARECESDGPRGCVPTTIRRRLEAKPEKCITLNDEQYCKVGSIPDRVLQRSTQHRRQRQLKATHKAAKKWDAPRLRKL